MTTWCACVPWLLAGSRRWCAGVSRSELVSNLPQLQAEGRVGSDGRLAEAVEVDREPELPAPVNAAPKSRVRAAVGWAVLRVVARLISACGCVCAGVCGAAGRGRGGGRVAVRAG